MREILVCIGGWGSRCAIFAPLLAQCPLLARRSQIELNWQNFVAITDPAERRTALREQLKQNLRQKGPTLAGSDNPKDESDQWEKTDIVILAWSLGCLLALELSLELGLKINLESSKKLGLQHWPRLMLFSPTAAMCQGAAAVPPIVLKMMRRKLNKPCNNVLADFAAKLATSPELTQNYLEQASTFNTEELSAGLAYLTQCDLREELQALPYPTLLLSGRNDAIIPVQQSMALAELLGQQARLEFPPTDRQGGEGGHYSPLLPAPQVIHTITEFLHA